MEIPVVSRVYLTGAFLTTAACAVDIVSPFSLYYNWELVFGQGQIWRLVTSYLFFGVFSIDFLFHMYFLVCSICVYISIYTPSTPVEKVVVSRMPPEPFLTHNSLSLLLSLFLLAFLLLLLIMKRFDTVDYWKRVIFVVARRISFT
jgi:Der1-like family